MKSLSIESQKFDYLKALHIVLFAIMMISCMLNSSNVRAATMVSFGDYQALVFELSADTYQSDATFKMRPPRRLRAKRVEGVD